MTVITGLDLSLTGTGVARLEVSRDRDPVVLLRTLGSTAPPKERAMEVGVRSLRLRKLSAKIIEHCVGSDLVLIEGPAVSRTTGHHHDRSGLWWLIVARLTGGLNLNVVEVTPGSIKTYATGKGNASKDAVLLSVARRYPDLPITDNNQADALVCAALGARFSGLPIEPDGLPKTHTRAVDGVLWTPNHH